MRAPPCLESSFLVNPGNHRDFRFTRQALELTARPVRTPERLTNAEERANVPDLAWVLGVVVLALAALSTRGAAVGSCLGGAGPGSGSPATGCLDDTSC